jgi:hypothetical protein
VAQVALELPDAVEAGIILFSAPSHLRVAAVVARVAQEAPQTALVPMAVLAAAVVATRVVRLRQAVRERQVRATMVDQPLVLLVIMAAAVAAAQVLLAVMVLALRAELAARELHHLLVARL